MRVFVTGATGFIGRAVVAELLSAGHKVLGLARSDEKAKELAATGAEVHRGDLLDLESLKAGAAACDGVIHLAFNHDFSDWVGNCEKDRLAIEAMGSVLVGTDKPFVVTSGTALLASLGTVATEDAPRPPNALARVASEDATKAVAALGVRACVVRLPPSVHGDEDKGFIAFIIAVAREKGVSAYVGEGRNRWPAVHRLDAAKLFRLALEKGTAGQAYHGVGDAGIEFRQLAETIGARLNIPVVSKTPEEAKEHFGWMAMFVQIDNPSSAELTKQRLGWAPSQPGLIADLEHSSHYFKNAV